MSTLDKAISIAVNAHADQKDKFGEPYLGHLFRVMSMGKTENEKIVGVLHDLVEDTHWTFDQLAEEGFEQEVINALKCLTKKSEEENYELFIDRVIMNRLAMRVKLNDLTDNMDLKRMKEITEKDSARLTKYLKAYHRIIIEIDHPQH